MKLSKPVIAAVSGYAVAGGLELSLLADLRVVEENAVFGVFCRRFGIFYDLFLNMLFHMGSNVSMSCQFHSPGTLARLYYIYMACRA